MEERELERAGAVETGAAAAASEETKPGMEKAASGEEVAALTRRCEEAEARAERAESALSHMGVAGGVNPSPRKEEDPFLAGFNSEF
jgi:hypothetical protein